MTISISRYRPLVLTFDAFGTLFYPRQPVAQQYAEIARKYGLSGLNEEDVGTSFRNGERRGSIILIGETHRAES